MMLDQARQRRRTQHRRSWRDRMVLVVDEHGNMTAKADVALRLCTRHPDEGRFRLKDPATAPPELLEAIARELAPPPILAPDDVLHPQATGMQAVPVPMPDFAVEAREARKAASRHVRRSRIVRFTIEEAGLSDLSPRQQVALYEIAASDVRLIVCQLGRQSGKTTHLAAPVAAYEGIVNAKAHTAGRTDRPTILVVANSQDQGRITREAIDRLLSAPAMAHLVEGRTADTIRLTTGIDIVVAPTNARTIRGRSVCVCILDEFALAQDSDGSLLSPQAAGELLAAIRPAMITYAHAKLIVTSTPRGRSGPFYEVVKEATDSGLLLTGRSWEMNPLDSVVADVKAQWAIDPPLARREFAAEFTDDIGQVLSLELLEAAQRPGDRLPPQGGTAYYMILDPSGLTGNDSYVAIIFHVDPAGVLVLDWWHSWRGKRGMPPDLRVSADMIADASKVYRPRSVTADQYAFGAGKLTLEDRGVANVRLLNLDQATKARGLSLVRQRLLAAQLLLPAAEPRFVTELAGLEVSRLPGGSERVAASRGMHDDFAMTVLMASLVAEDHVRQSTAKVISAPSPWD